MLAVHPALEPIDPKKTYSRPSGEDVTYKHVTWLQDGRILFVTDYESEFGRLCMWQDKKDTQVIQTQGANGQDWEVSAVAVSK